MPIKQVFCETFIGFIEEITEESISVQIVNGKIRGNNKISALTNYEIFNAIFPRETNQFVLENYYYRMAISYQGEQGIKVFSKKWPEITKIFFEDENIPEVYWVTFEFDFALTDEVNDYVNRSFLNLSRGENFCFAILDASSSKITHNGDYKKWKNDIIQCQENLREMMDNYKENIALDYELFFTTARLFNRRIQYTNDKDIEKENETENEKNNDRIELEESVQVFIQQLIVIEDNVASGNEGKSNYVVPSLDKMLNVKGVGITSLSQMLHSLWEKSFPVYSNEVYEYLKKMNYATRERSTTSSYEQYQKTINKLISITYESMRVKPDYTAISYFLKKKFSLYDIL